MNQMFAGSPGILNGYPGAVGVSGSPYQMQGGYYGPRSNVVRIALLGFNVTMRFWQNLLLGQLYDVFVDLIEFIKLPF